MPFCVHYIRIDFTKLNVKKLSGKILDRNKKMLLQ